MQNRKKSKVFEIIPQRSLVFEVKNDLFPLKLGTSGKVKVISYLVSQQHNTSSIMETNNDNFASSLIKPAL